MVTSHKLARYQASSQAREQVIEPSSRSPNKPRGVSR